MSVVVLQPLPLQRRAPGGGPKEEPPGPDVARSPDQVPHPLEAEHRVEDEKWDHRRGHGCVSGPRGDEVGHRAGLGDPLLQDLTVPGLGVGEQQPGIHRRVQLARGRVDLELPEQGVQAECPRLVRDDRHDPGPDRGIPY